MSPARAEVGRNIKNVADNSAVKNGRARKEE